MIPDSTRLSSTRALLGNKGLIFLNCSSVQISDELSMVINPAAIYMGYVA